ncbi:hypothetical protein [Amycolatopsis sp. NPDC001319]|uniref:hypothetical protein n=1 Tax=unclassified Amycolatopsis TaxID=2618356 RepID=UPI0036A9425C
MSAFDVLDQYGPAKLLGFLLAVTAFLTLHLARLPLVALAWLLHQAMCGIDHLLSTRITPAGHSRPRPAGAPT